MKQTYEILGYNQILGQLSELANTKQAKAKLAALEPTLKEVTLRKWLRETTQAKALIEEWGNPPIPLMERVEEFLIKSVAGELLMPEEIEQIGVFLTAVRRLKSYLEGGRQQQNGLAFYCENLSVQETLSQEIERTIRNGRIDDYASNRLQDIRRRLTLLEEKLNQKAEQVLRANKSYAADSFIVSRNGRICIPVKAAYKKKIAGSVIDQSSSGATLFIEPKEVARLQDELDLCKIEEDTEERTILYTLVDMIASQEAELVENIRVIVKLDFIFAKGKLSIAMNAIEPEINTARYIHLKAARHPLLASEECVPLDFNVGKGTNGVIITGPNTGGKTVAIKTVGLFSLMAGAGLHVPCEEADIAMNSRVLCDVGDGQNMADNLSTFSAHICNVIDILQQVNEESLVILDELGSGTDPAEGMGIAIAILEQLRLSHCLFLVTTHYPEVKEYAKDHPEIMNASMAFDRESLRPLYRLELGKSGDSCALYIAKRLGMPNEMLRTAAREAYGEEAVHVSEELHLDQSDAGLKKKKGSRIQKQQSVKAEARHGQEFVRGDSVMVQPEGKIAIVVTPADKSGNVLVQLAKEKRMVNHKRLKLQVAATELYPEDYDFSIVFDTVEERKKRHQMGRKYQRDLELHVKGARV